MSDSAIFLLSDRQCFVNFQRFFSAQARSVPSSWLSVICLLLIMTVNDVALGVMNQAPPLSLFNNNY